MLAPFQKHYLISANIITEKRPLKLNLLPQSGEVVYVDRFWLIKSDSLIDSKARWPMTGRNRF
jgi:hypothetical protein